jgi:hypothetical protein
LIRHPPDDRLVEVEIAAMDGILGQIGFDEKGGRATSRVLTRGNGMSGNRTALACRWNKARPGNRGAKLPLEKDHRD